MSAYPLAWVTRNLAVGHAPMSYEELDSLKEQGIDAIINLCGEFSDLHEIEQKSGFEVFWLPVPDQTAPKMEAMEQGLAWLDEAVYLGKKVLVHCHHGIGRTGTFVTAYLLRRGFSLKKAGKILEATRVNPTNFSQWHLLRKFGRKEGQLTCGEPTPDNRNATDLSRFYARYEQLLAKVDALSSPATPPCCTDKDGQLCNGPSTLELIEALYLHNKVNVGLSAERRMEVINRAKAGEGINGAAGADQDARPFRPGPGCPLRRNDSCLLKASRPVNCRLCVSHPDTPALAEIHEELAQLSREVFEALFGCRTDRLPPAVDLADSVSGRFIQRYFHYLAARENTDGRS
jgi:Polymorphic toxin system, DSP-PTPase phosphatase